MPMSGHSIFFSRPRPSLPFERGCSLRDRFEDFCICDMAKYSTYELYAKNGKKEFNSEVLKNITITDPRELFNTEPYTLQ